MNTHGKSSLFQGELVAAITPDQVKLHGLYSSSEVSSATSLDAAVVLHGLGGNFYSSTLNLKLADALKELGMAVVLGNTRGHDGISTSTVAGRAQTLGAACEIVDDCRHDISGWVEWLTDHGGFRRILLLGHSLGAIKALYSQALSPMESVKGIVGLSATRLCHENLLNSEKGDRFRKWFDLATELNQKGRGDEMLNVDFPFPTRMIAHAYCDKYGPQDRYDWIRVADQVSVPTLLMFGERELQDNAAFGGMLEQARTATERLPNYQLQVIPSANHFYAGVHDRAIQAMKDWLIDR